MEERRPVIGVTPDIDRVQNRGVDFARYQLYAEICDRVFEAEGLPLILPYTSRQVEVELLIDQVDGLIFTGGDFDIDPRSYGERPKPGLGTLKPQRTRFELALCNLARSGGVPVLGICGGHQLINVAFGGTLYQDLPLERPDGLEHTQKHSRKMPAHPVSVVPDCRLRTICGAGTLEVNSTHHQAIKQLASGLQAVAYAPDGLTEAIEAPEHPFCVGVQWHPETLEQAPDGHRQTAVFTALVEAAREGRRRG